VRDLERAGGFGRKDLLVVTTTRQRLGRSGAGGLDRVPQRRRLATVALQYSYLPSWVSYLVDQSKARERAGRSSTRSTAPGRKLPQGQRPRLFVAGESLGSFGGETAFSGENSMANLTSGVLFAGPPNFNTLFREFSDHRDAGSPEVQPVYQDGQIVRFANEPD